MRENGTHSSLPDSRLVASYSGSLEDQSFLPIIYARNQGNVHPKETFHDQCLLRLKDDRLPVNSYNFSLSPVTNLVIAGSLSQLSDLGFGNMS